jgi:hypothetical protein
MQGKASARLRSTGVGEGLTIAAKAHPALGRRGAKPPVYLATPGGFAHHLDLPRLHPNFPRFCLPVVEGEDDVIAASVLLISPAAAWGRKSATRLEDE